MTSGSKNQEMFEYYRLTNGRYKPVKTLKYLNIGDILNFCGITRTENGQKTRTVEFSELKKDIHILDKF